MFSKVPARIEIKLHATDEDSADITVTIKFDNRKIWENRFVIKQNNQANIKFNVELE